MIKKQLDVSANVVRDGVLRFVASTEDVDRDGDKIRVAGWLLDNWEKNPVFLWSHMDHMPPIGKGIGYEIGEHLTIDVEFAQKGRDYDDWPAFIPSPETVYRLYEGGFLRAVSVGFLPTQYKAGWEMDDEERESIGLAAFGVLYEEQELLELSAVAVPSNPNALILAMDKGYVDPEQAKVWQEFLSSATNPAILVTRIQEAVEASVRKALGEQVHRELASQGRGEAPVLDFRKLWDEED